MWLCVTVSRMLICASNLACWTLNSLNRNFLPFTKGKHRRAAVCALLTPFSFVSVLIFVSVRGSVVCLFVSFIVSFCFSSQQTDNYLILIRVFTYLRIYLLVRCASFVYVCFLLVSYSYSLP